MKELKRTNEDMMKAVLHLAMFNSKSGTCLSSRVTHEAEPTAVKTQAKAATIPFNFCN